MFGKGKPGQLLAEILHHVVAFELAVDQDVETDLFLPVDGAGRFGLQEGVILRRRQLPLGVGRTRLAHLGGLRKRSDRRGRKSRQSEAPALNLRTRLERALAMGVRFGNPGQTGGNLGIVDLGRYLAQDGG